MKRPHPASLLLLGLAILLAASFRERIEVFVGGPALTLVALLAATSHLRLLLRRSRWLLLTMLVMFGWLTPGTPLLNIPGASQEGLLLAADSITRLVIALSTVALILKLLSPSELVAGMRSLLAPLVLFNLSRDLIAVRLALTLKEVEASQNGDRSEPGFVPGMVVLPDTSLGPTDLALGALAGALVLAAWLA